MKESTALRRQARSDIEAGNALGAGTCTANLRPHVVAKAQQAVEKVVKAAVVALLVGPKVQLKLVGNPTTNARAPRAHAVRNFAWAISLIAPLYPTKDPIHRLAKAFPMARRLTIADLDLLVPEWPHGKQHTQRNTEYPYEPLTSFDWVPPCEAFTEEETARFFDDARKIVHDVDRLVDALERVYP